MMSDDFDAILDRCLADIAAEHKTIDSCLRHYPAQADQLAVLLRAAERARTVPPPASLPANKRRALESQLVRRTEQLHSRLVSRQTVPRLPMWRRGVALLLASFIVGVLLLGSAASASASSMPGDFLYPVKRATEQVRLALAPDEQQVDLHLEFARQRLQELRVLADRGELSEDLLAEISDETALMLDRIPALSQNKQQTLLASLTDFQDQQLQALEVIALSVQGDAYAKVSAALADSRAKRKLAIELLAGAASGNNPTDGSRGEPSSTILKEETRPAQGNPAAKQATLKATKVPPPTPQKPTPKVEHTPPGSANQPTPHSPPEKPTKVPKE